MAIAIARAVNCLEPRSTNEFERDACGKCASCRRIERGVHPDVIVIEPGDTGSIKIEAVRDAIDRAGYRPFEARRRVVIIDDAEALVPAAQNALLKTLEEMPAASIFVLVSSIPDALCRPCARAARVLDSDRSPRQKSRRRWSAITAIRKLMLARQPRMPTAASAVHCLPIRRTSPRRGTMRGACSSRPRDRGSVASSRRGQGSQRHQGTSASDRDQMAACLRALASLLRDLGIVATQADRRTLANADLESQLEKLTGSFDHRRSLKAYAAVDEALNALERNASTKVVADWLVLQL